MTEFKVSLSLWDTGGQARFEFFRTDFYKGCAAVGLVFDLSRPETFDEVQQTCKEIRKRSGNIPIILVGNKDDLQEVIGEAINRDQIIDFVNQYNLFEYVQTSALKAKNVDFLFKRLAITSLLDLQPRRGEIDSNDYDHFRFKILLAGSAAVGKSSLIKNFVKKDFKQNYKITVGIDFMVQDINFPKADLSSEVKDKISEAVAHYKETYGKKIKGEEEIAKTEEIPVQDEPETLKSEVEAIAEIEPSDVDDEPLKPKVFNKKPIYIAILSVIIVLIVITIIHFIGL